MYRQREGLTLLLEGSRRAIPLNIMLAALLALDLLYSHVPKFIIGTWFTAIILASVGRWLFCHFMLKRHFNQKNTDTILMSFIFLTFLIGTIWGVSYLIMLPYLVEFHEFIIILVFAGMAAGSIASLSICLPAYYAYVIPMFIPVIVYNYWMVQVDRTILGTMFLLFVIMVLISAKINNRVLNRIFELSSEKELLIKELKLLSITDSLTGLFNRRHYETMVREELARAKLRKYNLVLLLIDIDDFKLINDNYGHPYGDKILIATATWLEHIFRRANDTVFRIGGDEFSIILANQSIEEVVTMCNTLTDQLNEGINCGWDNDLEEVLKKISLSMGIISVPFTSKSSYEQLMTAIDKALYQAKKEGKSRQIITTLI